MKKYTAFLASVVMLSNAASINTNATEYAPDTDYLYGVQAVKAYVEQNGETWLDLNSDGKFDIFDVYAFYSVDSSGIEECTVPDYIQQKHDSMPTADLDFTYGSSAHRSYGDREMDHYFECSYEGYIPGSYDIMDYFLAVNHPHAEYTDPNFYIDNCPDEYNDIIPHDLIRHDDGVWDIYELRKTQAFIREEDGQFRRITKDDVTVYETGYDPNFGHYANCTSLDSLSREKDIRYSRIHRFTEALRSKIYVTGTGSFVMKDLIEKGIIDADINSDGVFNFEDVALTAYTAYSVVGLESSYSLAEIALPDYRINEVLESEDFSNRPITREGKEKAFRLYETAAAYMYPSWREIPVALAEYCVTSQETDPKFFDFDFYDENNYGFYRSYPVLENLALYEELSIRFGPSSEEIELPERMSFTRDEINEAFPEYYKNVKSGKLPEPDIDLDGKIDDADFNILFNLECEFSAPYKKDYLGVMVRRYPELLPVIGVSQEVRENFETNFDFNNNGISADLLETECMLMYIYGELDKNYADTQAFLDAQQAYFGENPDVQYYRVFNENHLWFSREHGKGWDGGLTANEELDSIVAAIAEFNTDMTVEEGTVAPATPGDANIDTRVNIADAVSVLQYVSNKTKYPMTAQGLANADCDGEAGITGSDASAIQRLDAGII